jgi:hypothetical protein
VPAPPLQGLRQHYVLDSPAAGCYAEWIDSDTPGAPEIFTDFYVYHIGNPWEVVHHGAKPNLTEVGPLRYRFKQRKLHVHWDPEDLHDVVSYVQQQYYVPADAATAALAASNVTSIWCVQTAGTTSDAGEDGAAHRLPAHLTPAAPPLLAAATPV